MRNGKIRRHLEHAGIRLQLAAYEREQPRFTTAILACDSNFLTPEQPEGGAGERNTRSASYGDVGEVEHAVRLLSLTGSMPPGCSTRRHWRASRFHRARPG